MSTRFYESDGTCLPILIFSALGFKFMVFDETLLQPKNFL